LQFEKNMRFDHINLSYSIESNCDAKRIKGMIAAFNYLESKSTLTFYQSSNADINVNCSEEKLKQEEYDIAGEGGPEGDITQTNLFSIIYKGKIILMQSDTCQENVALHELLHVFGFEHSDNPKSIMYNISSCNQVLTNDIINEINRLYSIPALPDLYFEDISAVKKGSYLNFNFTVRNQGLTDSENVSVILYSDNKQSDSFSLGKIVAGAGKIELIKNERVSSDNLKLIISAGDEINQENNIAELTLN
jgi:hypothetical protein